MSRKQVCPVCDAASKIGKTHALCEKADSLDGLITLFKYQDPIEKYLKEIKYQFVSHAVGELVDLLPKNYLLTLPQQSVLVPIPLHKKRLAWRGFNQAELIAKALGKRMNRPVNTKLIQRIKHHTPQADIPNRAKRLQNAHGIFAVNTKAVLPETLIIIDDVWTTGATISEAAKILKKAGAKNIWALTIAR